MMSKKRTHNKEPLILHSDNRSPMKGTSLLEIPHQLRVVHSHSRQRVSNDKAYAESIFKTFKYRPGYSHKGFKDIESARVWVNGFTKWYNINHHHSGLNFLTPNQRQSRLAEEILMNRTAVYEVGRTKNPEHWAKGIRN